MTEEWVCPHCGHENENTERIALKEQCRRCRNERTTVGCLEQEQYDKLEELELEKCNILDKIQNVESLMNLLKPEFRSDSEKKRSELLKQYRTIETAILEINEKPIYREKVRHIYKDQKTISDFKRE